jgi:hypothetical protein
MISKDLTPALAGNLIYAGYTIETGDKSLVLAVMTDGTPIMLGKKASASLDIVDSVISDFSRPAEQT